MPVINKQQLDVENQTSFPNNSTGYITPERLRNFNTDIIDSMVDEVSYIPTQAALTASVVALQLFSGSEYKTDSASFDLRTDNLEAWSSSLDLTYATDAQLNYSSSVLTSNLNASSSTLQSNINQKLDTSSFNTFSSSVYTSVSASTFFSGTQYKNDSSSFTTRLIQATGSTAANSSSIGLLQTFSGSQYKADSSSFDFRIQGLLTASVPVGTVSSSAQIAALGYATTSSVTSLSSSTYLTDVTQSINITQASASAWGAFQSASAYSASGYQSDSTQSFQITANALTASNATTIVSQSAWGAFQSASAYSASNYQTDTTQSFQIIANALTASNATTALSSSAFTSYVKLNGSNAQQVITGSLLLSSSLDVELTVIGNQINSGNLDISGALTASIPQGYAWVGGAGNRATLALTSSIQGVQFPYTGSANITGSLSVTGSYNIVTGSASGSLISNAGDIYTTANVFKIISLTSAEYAAIVTKDLNTLYIIV